MKRLKSRPFLLLFFSFLAFGFVFNSIQDQETQLIAIANEYKTYSQDVSVRTVVTDSSKYKWTIALCAYHGEDIMGYHHEFDSTFFSKADTAVSPHGNKLYKLFVKDQSSYDFISRTQPIGQTLVKETWNIKEVDQDSSSLYTDAILSENDGKWYRPSTVSQLFIMYKEEPNESNDNGWVYGIVDVESKSAPKVLSRGKISSCISCHKGTKYDRLFGSK